MKKLMRLIMMPIMMLIMMLMLTGCGDNPISLNLPSNPKPAEPNHATAFVCGIHENYPFYGALANPNVQEAAYQIAYDYGRVIGYIVDGDPFLVVNQTVQKPDANVNNQKREWLAKERENGILNSLTTEEVLAKTDEVDTLQAIIMTAKTLQSTGCDKKEMYILDSGLSTTGILNFASKNIINSDPAYIVESLKKQHAIPELEGITVYWIGLGQTCGDQQTLTPDYLYKLEQIWKAILSEGGVEAGALTINTEGLENTDLGYQLPSVSSIPIIVSAVEGAVIQPEEEHVSDDSGTNGFGEEKILAFDEDTEVRFQPNTAVFIEDAAAAEELAPVINFLASNPGSRVYIAGMTATYGDRESCRQLSLERAGAVANLIMYSDDRVSADQMTILGLGYEPNFLRVDDVINGEFIEEEAKKNRAVYVMGENATGLDTLIEISAK